MEVVIKLQEIEKKDKLAVVGAGDFQRKLIIKAKQKGMETHVFAWECDDAGEQEADYFYPISIVEKEQILEKCREINPVGIISIASDLAVVAVNYVAEKLGLTGNGIKSTLITTNKYFMRKTFERRGDPSPRYISSDELTDDLMKMLHLPLIIKPVDRSGNRGVTKISDRTEIEKAVSEAKNVSFEKKAVIEEYVDGQEYSVEYISWKGKHTFLALTQKFTTGEPYFVETGHVQPAKVPVETLQKIQEIVQHALDSLLIKNGASHSEIKITPSGDIKIIEIGARMGGDCIGSDLVQISTGYDYIDMVIDIACGKEPSFKKICKGQRAEIQFILNQEDLRKFEEIKSVKPECIYYVSELRKPEEGKKVRDSTDRCGYYIMQG